MLMDPDLAEAEGDPYWSDSRWIMLSRGNSSATGAFAVGYLLSFSMVVQSTASKDLGPLLGTHECYLTRQECRCDSEEFSTILGSSGCVLCVVTVDFLRGRQKELWHKRERGRYRNKSFFLKMEEVTRSPGMQGTGPWNLGKTREGLSSELPEAPPPNDTLIWAQWN